MNEYEIITYVKSLEVVFDSKIKAKKYLELIRELDSESVHVLKTIEDTGLLCDSDELVEDVKDGFVIDTNGCNTLSDAEVKDEVNNWLSVKDSPTTNWIEMIDSTNQCPECKSELQHSGGRVICNLCGYTKCE